MSLPEHEALLAWILEGRPPAEQLLTPVDDLAERLETYRGGFSVRTFSALGSVFPRTARVLGEDWQLLGRRFAFSLAPAEPNLNLIGRALPAFLRDQGAPSLARALAALEWTAFELVHAERTSALDAAALATLDEGTRLALAPDQRRVSIDDAVLAAWPAPPREDSTQALLSTRSGEATLTPLSSVQARFLAVLDDAANVGGVIESAGLDAAQLGGVLAWAVDAAILVRR